MKKTPAKNPFYPHSGLPCHLTIDDTCRPTILSKSQEFLLRLVMVITICSLVVMTNMSQLFTVGTFVVVRDIDDVSVFEKKGLSLLFS